MRAAFCPAFFFRLAVGFALAAPCAISARGPLLEWTDCRLEENDSNDGDSFHVKAGGKEYILRLYLVDAPESDDSFPERVAEQAKYFGITPTQSVELGELAAKFVGEKLAQPFTVRTSKQSAMGRSSAPRYYAFVQTSEGDLGEMLVANGLARVHGVAPAENESYSPTIAKQKLNRLESDAKRLQVGGWGAASGRMTARVISSVAKPKQDSFDAFFHPARPVIPQTQMPLPVATPMTKAHAQSNGKRLDVNTASASELMKLKGIGPVLAQRIVEARPFKSADDLRRVKGIGRKKYEQIRSSFEPAL